MKKIIIAACMALLGCGSVFAQQGKQAIGGNLSYGTEIESVGIGLKYQYNITDQIRIEPSMNYFFKNDGLSMFDINANIHYLFPIASNIEYDGCRRIIPRHRPAPAFGQQRRYKYVNQLRLYRYDIKCKPIYRPSGRTKSARCTDPTAIRGRCSCKFRGTDCRRTDSTDSEQRCQV